MKTRRDFLKSIGVSSGLLLVEPALVRAGIGSYEPTPEAANDPWKQLPAILARIKPPRFPNRDFNIAKFGAVGDNKTDCTEAFRKAIAACNAAGGGRVLVPAGQFLNRRDPSQEQCRSASRSRRNHQIQPRSETISAACVHAMGGH